MNNKEINNHPFVKYANDLDEICKDFFKKTPVNFFEPCRVYNSNEYSGFMTDKKWAKHFVEKNYQSSGIGDYQRSELSSDFVLWSSSGMFDVSSTAQELWQDCIEFNYGNGITLIERHDNYTQFYYFASNTGPHTINSYFIENVDQLYRFILHFKEKVAMSKKLSAAYKRIVKVDPKKSVAMTASNKDQRSDIPLPKRFYFIGKNNEDVYLTAKELVCVYYYWQRYSIKHIASIMCLSHRTVEMHLANAKNKFYCKSIDELFFTLRNQLNFNWLKLKK